MDLYREIDVRGVLPAIDVPTLVVQRRDDRISTVGQGRYIAEAVPGAKYVELEGADHLPIAGDQDALLDEVESSSLAAVAAANRSGRWRRSSSPTSSARPHGRRSSATAPGASCSSATMPPSAASSTSTAAAR